MLSKNEIRKRMRIKRTGLPRLVIEPTAECLALFPRQSVVSGYIAQGDEANPANILIELHNRGIKLCLPVTTGRETPLLFRQWRPSDALAPDAFGIPAPLSTAPAIIPTHLILPLVSFDRVGTRLGQGAGHYDRTLAGLSGVTIIGFGYSEQEYEKLPVEEFDIPLHYVLTEKELIKIKT